MQRRSTCSESLLLQCVPVLYTAMIVCYERELRPNGYGSATSDLSNCLLCDGLLLCVLSFAVIAQVVPGSRTEWLLVGMLLSYICCGCGTELLCGLVAGGLEIRGE